MSPNGGGDPQGELATAIESSFGSFESLNRLFPKLLELDLVQAGLGFVFIKEET